MTTDNDHPEDQNDDLNPGKDQPTPEKDGKKSNPRKTTPIFSGHDTVDEQTIGPNESESKGTDPDTHSSESPTDSNSTLDFVRSDKTIFVPDPGTDNDNESNKTVNELESNKTFDDSVDAADQPAPNEEPGGSNSSQTIDRIRSDQTVDYDADGSPGPSKKTVNDIKARDTVAPDTALDAAGFDSPAPPSNDGQRGTDSSESRHTVSDVSSSGTIFEMKDDPQPTGDPNKTHRGSDATLFSESNEISSDPDSTGFGNPDPGNTTGYSDQTLDWNGADDIPASPGEAGSADSSSTFTDSSAGTVSGDDEIEGNDSKDSISPADRTIAFSGKPTIDEPASEQNGDEPPGTAPMNTLDVEVDSDLSMRTIQTFHGTDAGSLQRGWGKLNTGITPMSSLESRRYMKETVDYPEPELNDRLAVDEQKREVKLPPGIIPDYRIRGFLGEGAMGKVYIARQTSVDRDVAFKKQILRKADTEQKRKKHRRKFLFEAQVTANLDHPNIVAIHDMGRDQQGEIFYCMELVHGKPWANEFENLSVDENIDILLKVVDGMAYAHSRNTIHRDLKPENIMLGKFGEVLIMDWGLGVNLDFGPPGNLGGTPSFMAPEMARRTSVPIGKHSDIYLLGAILFLIATGKTPHDSPDVWKCLEQAGRNEIIDLNSLDQPYDRRLTEIAMRAMRTAPEDRFSSAEQFKVAVENYRSNKMSIRLAERSGVELEQAIEGDDYELFSRSLFGFQEARSMWLQNQLAADGIGRARHAYATCALKRNDYELGLSLLDREKPEDQPLVRKLEREIRNRDRRKRMVVIAVASSILLLTALVATSWLSSIQLRSAFNELASEKDKVEEQFQRAETEKHKAETAADEKEEQRIIADDARKRAEELAVKEKQERERAENLAVKEKQERERAENLAVKEKQERERAESLAIKEKAARQRAEELQSIAEKATDEKETERIKADTARQEAVQLAGQLSVSEKSARERLFQSNIGLVDSFIRDNQIDEAIETLEKIRQTNPEFVDWEWKRLFHLCHTEVRSLKLDKVVDVAQSPGGSAVAVSSWGTALFLPGGAKSAEETGIADGKLFCVTISPDGKFAAIGSADPKRKLTIWDIETAMMVANLSDQIEPDASLVSSVAFGPGGQVLAAGDSRRVVSLFRSNVPTGNGRPNWERETQLRFHSNRPTALSFDASGRQLASVSTDGLCVIWNLESGQPRTAYQHDAPLLDVEFVPGENRVACASVQNVVFVDTSRSNDPLKWRQLDPQDFAAARQASFAGTLPAHNSNVRALSFSEDGGTLVTCGDDRTIAVWDSNDLSSLGRFRGHVNEIVSVTTTGAGNSAISASADGAIRFWRFDRYEDQRNWSSADNSGLNTIAFNREGTQILTGDDSGTVLVRGIDSSGDDARFEFDPQTGLHADYVPQSKTIVTSGSGRVFVWRDGKLLYERNVVGKAGLVSATRDGKYLITCGDESRPTLVLDLESGETVATLLNAGAENSVTAVELSPDSRFAVFGTGQVEGVLSFFDLRDFRLLQTEEAHRGWISDLAFAPDSRRVLSADSIEGYVNVWRIENSAATREAKLGEIRGSYVRLDFSRDGSRFVSTANIDSNRSEIRVWDSRSLETLRTNELIRPINFVSMINDEVTFKLSNGKAYAWKHASGQREIRRVAELSNADYPQGINGWIHLSEGRNLVYGNGFVEFVGSAEQKEGNFAAAGNPGPCVQVEFSDSSQRIFALHSDGAIRVRGRESGGILDVIQPESASLTCLAVSPHAGDRVAVGQSDGAVRCLDPETLEVVFTVDLQQPLSSIHWISQNQLLAVGGQTGASLVNIETGAVDRPAAMLGEFQSAAVSDDGRSIVLLESGDQAGARLIRLEGEAWNRQSRFGSRISTAALSPDGGRIFTGDSTGAVTVWYAPEADSTEAPRKLISLLGHKREVTEIVVSDDGAQVASSAADGTAILWLAAEPDNPRLPASGDL